ncbi:hypothetical protein ACTND3_01825 [Bacillota bacterium HCP28S3_F12]
MKSIKKNWKQNVALLLAIILVVSLAGCGAKEGKGTQPESQEVVATSEGSNTEAADEADAAEKVEENGTAPVDDVSEADPVIDASEVDEEELAETDDVEDLTEGESGADSSMETAPEKSEEETIETANETSATETQDTEERTNLLTSVEEEPDDGLTPEMRKSINMLNYMTSLTQQVNEQKNNQLFLESAYDSFDNLYPNSVDTKTQAQITSLMDTIQGYRMISVKRDRLEYIYEQNRAQALRQAIPNPVGLLSAVQSGSLLKAAASVLYMAVDSASSYKAATTQADLQFIKDGWELDDEESAELHNSTKNALTYMLNMVRDYDIPGDYALNKAAVEDFVTWSSKPDSQLERKISWFETNQNTYEEFGPYWLELAKDYYNYEDYAKCLTAIKKYEGISTRIFRKDQDYAQALPMAIISAKETLSNPEYVSIAANYCQIIDDNTDDEDWTLRYFAAQIYMDLYAITKDTVYLDEAYKIARENVVVLVDEQKKLNAAYIAEIQEVKAGKDATKREKNEVKKYNKTIKEERKIALPPVSEALYLNSDLLFALAEERKIDDTERKKIEAILHENGENIFLTQALDDRFWFNKKSAIIDSGDIEVSFEGGKFIIPASCVTDRSIITVKVTGANGATNFDEWLVDEVKRPKNSTNCSEFTVTYTNKDSDKYKYQAGETVTIRVTPVAESPEEYMEFKFNVVATKKVVVFNGVKFERVTK